MSGDWDSSTNEFWLSRLGKTKKEVEDWINGLVDKVLEEKGIEVIE